jgi:hypothetical protein
MYAQNHLSTDDPSAKPCRMLQVPDLLLRFARLIMLRRIHSSKADRAWCNECSASEEGQKQGQVVIVMMVVEKHACTAFENAGRKRDIAHLLTFLYCNLHQRDRKNSPATTTLHT